MIGSILTSVDGEALTATMFSADGIVVAEAAHATIGGLARLLARKGLAGKITVRGQPIRATITSVVKDLIIVDAGAVSGVRKGHWLRIDRVLETVSEPWLDGAHWALANLTAKVGTAWVVEVGPLASLAQFTGPQPPRTGDLVTGMPF